MADHQENKENSDGGGRPKAQSHNSEQSNMVKGKTYQGPPGKGMPPGIADKIDQAEVPGRKK